MSTSPAITVIVPGFDVAAYAREAIDSLRAQSREDWTAILVDDGSTDTTGAIFDAAAAADARFHVVHHSLRAGLSAARNTGLDLVRTPYVGFLDADDVMDPRALEVLVGTLERTGSDLVAGAYVRLRPDGDGGYRAGDVQPWVSAATDPARDRVTLASHPQASGNIVAWSKVSRAEMWRERRFPLARAYEDQILAQELYSSATTFDVVPDVVVKWRVRADGSSITQSTRSLVVLQNYLDALDGGIAVLERAGFAVAAASRVELILTLDLPPLVAIGASHPDPAYRHALGEFTRSLRARVAALPDPVAAALTW